MKPLAYWWYPEGLDYDPKEPVNVPKKQSENVFEEDEDEDDDKIDVKDFKDDALVALHFIMGAYSIDRNTKNNENRTIKLPTLDDNKKANEWLARF